MRPPYEERVGSEGENVVDGRGEVVREVEQRADTPPHCFGSVHGPQPDGPVVDELDAGRERPAVGRSRQRQDRARRRRGAGALRAAGEDVGVAFVQAGDGVAQPVDGEDLTPPASPLYVDLDQNDLFSLIGADIELRTGKAARRRRRTAQRERVAKGCEQLVPTRRVSSAQQRAPTGEDSLQVPRGAGGMIHGLVLVGPQGGECVGVSGSDRGIETDSGRRRGVCSHPSLAFLHSSGWRGGR